MANVYNKCPDLAFANIDIPFSVGSSRKPHRRTYTTSSNVMLHCHTRYTIQHDTLVMLQMAHQTMELGNIKSTFKFKLITGHRRTGQHPFGGGGRPSFARMDSVGVGVVAEIFRDPYSVGWHNCFR